MISDNLPSNLLLRQSLGLSPSTDEQFKQSGFTPSGSQISNLFQSVMNANSNKCSSKQLDNSGDFFRSQQSLSSQLSSSPAVLQPSLEKPKREFPCDYRAIEKIIKNDIFSNYQGKVKCGDISFYHPVLPHQNLWLLAIKYRD